jgi:hypothetical protein
MSSKNDKVKSKKKIIIDEITEKRGPGRPRKKIINDEITEKRAPGRPRKTDVEKVNKKQYVKCDICGPGVEYQRTNRAKHFKTKIHQMNLRMLNMLKEARIKEMQKKPMTINELRASRYGKKIINNLKKDTDPENEIDILENDDFDLDDVIYED